MKVLLFLLLLLNMLYAVSVGTVVSLKGDARVFTKGVIAPKNAVQGMSLEVGQTLKTRLNSEANIKFLDNTKVIVGANSSLEILELKKLGVAGEKVLFKVAKQKDIKGLSIVTQSAVIGIRGTTFMISSDGKAQAIYLQEGEINVKPPSGTFKSYLKSDEDDFNQYKEQLEKEFAKYVDDITMKGATAVSIDGNEVHQLVMTKEIEAELEALKRF